MVGELLATYGATWTALSGPLSSTGGGLGERVQLRLLPPGPLTRRRIRRPVPLRTGYQPFLFAQVASPSTSRTDDEPF